MRQLVKGGFWCVPPEERPANWRNMPVKEALAEGEAAVPLSTAEKPDCKPAVDKPEPTEAAPVPATESAPCDPWKLSSWRMIKRAVKNGAKWFCGPSDKAELTRCGLLLVAGMWTRDPQTLCKMAGFRLDDITPYIERCYDYWLWHDGRVVVLWDDDENADLNFWLNVMAVAGKVIRNTDGTFTSIHAKETLSSLDKPA